MEYRSIGDTGLEASVLGIGTMRFKGVENATEVIQRALDLGLNYLDCGSAYSFKDDQENAEAWTGRAIQGRKRETMILSAKAQPRSVHAMVDKHLGIHTRDQMWQCIENSLRRLGVEYLDFYQFWDLSAEEHYQTACVGQNAPWRAMLEAQDQKLVRHLGITTHAAPRDIMSFIERTPELRFITVYYNFAKRQVEPAIEYAHEHQLGVAVMGPLYGGLLTGRSPVLSREGKGLVRASVQELAFNFLCDNECITTCLGGMNSLFHLEENIEIVDRFVSMNQDERHQFRAACQEFNEVEALCSGCLYCENACPQNLQIHQLMNCYQIREIFRLDTMNARLAQMKTSGQPNLDTCTACGICTERCPQNLPIADRIKVLSEILKSL